MGKKGRRPGVQNLPRSEREALSAYRDTLLKRLPGQVRKLILFGSRARGQAQLDSDIDVMVVVGWKEERREDGFWLAPFGDPRWQAIVDTASDVSLEHDVYISPLVISEERFGHWSPLVNRVRKEGVELWSQGDPG